MFHRITILADGCTQYCPPAWTESPKRTVAHLLASRCKHCREMLRHQNRAHQVAVMSRTSTRHHCYQSSNDWVRAVWRCGVCNDAVLYIWLTSRVRRMNCESTLKSDVSGMCPSSCRISAQGMSTSTCGSAPMSRTVSAMPWMDASPHTSLRTTVKWPGMNCHSADRAPTDDTSRHVAIIGPLFRVTNVVFRRRRARWSRGRPMKTLCGAPYNTRRHSTHTDFCLETARRTRSRPASGRMPR